MPARRCLPFAEHQMQDQALGLPCRKSCITARTRMRTPGCVRSRTRGQGSPHVHECRPRRASLARSSSITVAKPPSIGTNVHWEFAQVMSRPSSRSKARPKAGLCACILLFLDHRITELVSAKTTISSGSERSFAKTLIRTLKALSGRVNNFSLCTLQTEISLDGVTKTPSKTSAPTLNPSMLSVSIMVVSPSICDSVPIATQESVAATSAPRKRAGKFPTEKSMTRTREFGGDKVRECFIVGPFSAL